MKDFFISYNKADRAWAEWIAWHLEEAGYTTILQAWDFTTGSNFVLKMHDAATEAARTVAVLSPDYLASNFTKPEWAAAFAQDPTGEKGLLIPIRVRPCDPAGLLGQIVYGDLVGTTYEPTAKAQLLAAVNRGRAKPGPAPAFPPTAGRASPDRPRFPGALPPIWNVPHRRNPNFTGREELLEELHRSLTSGQFGALTQAMHGLGGVGKTQTATEYAYRYAAEYDAVLWLPAEDPVVLAGYFAGLAKEIGLDVDLTDQKASVDAVKRWLREYRRWLLIFDNVEKSADVDAYLPQAGGGHVIITSRNPEWRRIARPLEVESFSADEAVAFLLKRVGSDVANTDESAAAAAVNEHLDGLALALEQAAAYVEAHGISLREYLRLLETHREAALIRETSPDYPWTIDTVWSISFEAVRRDSPAGAELLTLLAFFAPDNIPLDLIRTGERVYTGALAISSRDDLELRSAIRTLRRHSLVVADDELVSVHRVLQSVTRRSLSDTQRRDWAHTAILVVHAGLPHDPERIASWLEYSRLTPHVSVAAQHCETEETGLEEASYCLNQAGLYLFRRADYASAHAYLERSVRIAKVVFGENHPNVATSIVNLGNVYRGTGNLTAARMCYELALEIDEATFGPNHPEVATDVNNLGGVYKLMGELHAARESYQRALEIDQASLAPDHPNIARDVNNLGGIESALGEFSAAEHSFKQALAIAESVLGSDHPDVATIMNNLGMVLQSQTNFSGAKEYLTKALSIFRKSLGDDHPNTLTAQENLERLVELTREEGSRG